MGEGGSALELENFEAERRTRSNNAAETESSPASSNGPFRGLRRSTLGDAWGLDRRFGGGSRARPWELMSTTTTARRNILFLVLVADSDGDDGAARHPAAEHRERPLGTSSSCRQVRRLFFFFDRGALVDNPSSTTTTGNRCGAMCGAVLRTVSGIVTTRQLADEKQQSRQPRRSAVAASTRSTRQEPCREEERLACSWCRSNCASLPPSPVQ